MIMSLINRQPEWRLNYKTEYKNLEYRVRHKFFLMTKLPCLLLGPIQTLTQQVPEILPDGVTYPLTFS